MNVKMKMALLIILNFYLLTILDAKELSWSQLEKSLVATPEEMFSPKPLFAALQKQQPTIRTNTRLLTEMASQSTYTYPSVAIAGFAGLLEADPKLAYRVSLNQLWCTTNIGFVAYLPFLECLTNNIAPEDFRAALSSVALSEPKDLKSAIIVVMQIPSKYLVDWLLSDDRKNSSVTTEAIVIDKLMSHRKELTTDQLTTVLRHLKNLRQCPGVPRAVFLMHSDEEPALLIADVETVLEDASVDNILKLNVFMRQGKKLNGLLNIDRLNVSDKQKGLFRKWLSNYSK